MARSEAGKADVTAMDLAPTARKMRTRNIAAVSFILLHGYFVMNCSARAEDLADHQILDMSSLTCSEFERLSLPKALLTIGWVGGFYAGRKNETTVDIPVFVQTAERLIAFCRENPSLNLMGAVDQELLRGQEPGHARPPSALSH